MSGATCFLNLILNVSCQWHDGTSLLNRNVHLLDPGNVYVEHGKHIAFYQKTTGHKYPDKRQRNLYVDHNDEVVLADDINRSPCDYILHFSFFVVNEIASLQLAFIEHGAGNPPFLLVMLMFRSTANTPRDRDISTTSKVMFGLPK